MFNDGDQTYYDNRTIRERFIKPIYPYDFERKTDNNRPNKNKKSIIKCGDWKDIGGNSDIAEMHTHSPDRTKLCNLLGQGWPFYNPLGMDFTVGQVSHYFCKSAEEFAYKMARGGVS